MIFVMEMTVVIGAFHSANMEFGVARACNNSQGEKITGICCV